MIANGAYGERMADIAEHAKLNYLMYRVKCGPDPSADEVAHLLSQHPEITHVAMVHSETTSGILNDIASVTNVVKSAEKTMIVDAMSSFGGVDIPVGELQWNPCVSSANKCIQGVPGFSFIICRHDSLAACEGKARSLSLVTDRGKQWKKTANRGDSLPDPHRTRICKSTGGTGQRGGVRGALPNATMTTTVF